ncbi:hypothetical protein GQ55_6G261000 [Panicum hallii var. hallii]|uniref:Uncharacterized protein n=1 Tax=Panicum hallii var. hallii TaxID=1504633 RepID=A0A2T7D9T4_9POAL|nr:hypothetical protein GQ55_6G261000 [Panicum hallii var. hallii]
MADVSLSRRRLWTTMPDGGWELRHSAARCGRSCVCQPSSIPFGDGKAWVRLGHCDARHASMSWTRPEAEPREQGTSGPPPPPLPPLSLLCCAFLAAVGFRRRSRRRGPVGGGARRRTAAGGYREESERTSGLEIRQGQATTSRGRDAAAWP